MPIDFDDILKNPELREEYLKFESEVGRQALDFMRDYTEKFKALDVFTDVSMRDIPDEQLEFFREQFNAELIEEFYNKYDLLPSKNIRGILIAKRNIEESLADFMLNKIVSEEGGPLQVAFLEHIKTNFLEDNFLYVIELKKLNDLVAKYGEKDPVVQLMMENIFNEFLSEKGHYELILQDPSLLAGKLKEINRSKGKLELSDFMELSRAAEDYIKTTQIPKFMKSNRYKEVLQEAHKRPVTPPTSITHVYDNLSHQLEKQKGRSSIALRDSSPDSERSRDSGERKMMADREHEQKVLEEKRVFLQKRKDQELKEKKEFEAVHDHAMLVRNSINSELHQVIEHEPVSKVFKKKSQVSIHSENLLRTLLEIDNLRIQNRAKETHDLQVKLNKNLDALWGELSKRVYDPKKEPPVSYVELHKKLLPLLVNPKIELSEELKRIKEQQAKVAAKSAGPRPGTPSSRIE